MDNSSRSASSMGGNFLTFLYFFAELEVALREFGKSADPRQKIEIKEEIKETFQADPDFFCNFDVTPCVIQKESEENLPKDFLNVRKAPTKICCKEINKDNSNISTVHEEKSTYECQSCNASFFHKGDLNKHISAVHERKRPYDCQSCDASFYQKSVLISHISAVHEGKRPYNCQSCDATFSAKSSLNRHISCRHDGKRPYNCQKCNSTFAQRGNLNKHIFTIYVYLLLFFIVSV